MVTGDEIGPVPDEGGWARKPADSVCTHLNCLRQARRVPQLRHRVSHIHCLKMLLFDFMRRAPSDKASSAPLFWGRFWAYINGSGMFILSAFGWWTTSEPFRSRGRRNYQVSLGENTWNLKDTYVDLVLSCICPSLSHTFFVQVRELIIFLKPLRRSYLRNA